MSNWHGITDHAIDAYRATGVSPGRTSWAGIRDPRPGHPHRAVRYTVYGPAWAPAVVVLGGISADRHLFATAENPSPGWWPGVVGPGQALDPHRHRLIGIDFLSADDVRDYPSTNDQALAVEAVLSAEAIKRATIVGASYGGMVALAFASAFPERTTRLVVIAAAHRTHAMAAGIRSVQRAIVRLATQVDRESDGLSIARALAMTTYRSAAEFESRFSRSDDASERLDAVESYLSARGASYSSRTKAAHFLALSTSIDTHSVDPSRVRAPSAVVSFSTDTLVPPWLAHELAQSCAGPAHHIEIESMYGHDGFLKETAAVSSEIASVLRGNGGDL